MAAYKVKLQFSDFKTFLVTTENVTPLCTLFPEKMELEM